MKKTSKNIFFLFVGISIGLCIGLIAGITVGSRKEPVKEVAESENYAFDWEEVLRINGESIYLDEINVRIYMLRDEYVAQYGEDPWQTMYDETQTIGEYAKAAMLDQILREIYLCEYARAEGITVSNDEMKTADDDAIQYVAMLGEDVSRDFGITKEAVCRIYEKEKLSMAGYNHLLESFGETDESALMEQFDTSFLQWKETVTIDTTETWEMLTLGAQG